jgi:tetratricopeptide (TPR) repeat protein
MQEQVGPKQTLGSAEYQAILDGLNAGDRLYRTHLDPTMQANHLKEALNAYSRALEQDPEQPLALVCMAKVFFRQGQYPKAESYAKKALWQLPNESSLKRSDARFIRRESYYVLGMINYRAGHLDAAKTLLQKSAQAGGLSSCRARYGLFQTFRDIAFDRLFKPSALLPLAQAIYALLTSLLLFSFEPERIAFPVLLVLIPRFLIAWGQEELGMLDRALESYLAIQRDYPGLGSVGIILGELYRENNQLDNACYWFDKVINRHPGSLEAYYHKAKLMEDQEDFGEMAQIYEQLLKLKPADPHVYCNLANAYYYLSAYKEALNYYEMALQLAQEQHWKAMVAQSIGNIYCDYLQNAQAAIAYYQMARSLAPDVVENYIQLGMLYFQKEDFANAELIYRKAITIAPDNPRLHSNLGYLRWMDGDVEHAIQHYEKAIDLDSGYEIPINNLGVIYLDMLGQVQKAIELFQEAISIDPHYALAYYNLGRAYSFLDNRLEAANCFRSAQEFNHYSRELDNDELTARINHLFDTCEME